MPVRSSHRLLRAKNAAQAAETEVYTTFTSPGSLRPPLRARRPTATAAAGAGASRLPLTGRFDCRAGDIHRGQQHGPPPPRGVRSPKTESSRPDPPLPSPPGLPFLPMKSPSPTVALHSPKTSGVPDAFYPPAEPSQTRWGADEAVEEPPPPPLPSLLSVRGADWVFPPAAAVTEPSRPRPYPSASSKRRTVTVQSAPVPPATLTRWQPPRLRGHTELGGLGQEPLGNRTLLAFADAGLAEGEKRRTAAEVAGRGCFSKRRASARDWWKGGHVYRAADPIRSAEAVWFQMAGGGRARPEVPSPGAVPRLRAAPLLPPTTAGWQPFPFPHRCQPPSAGGETPPHAQTPPHTGEGLGRYLDGFLQRLREGEGFTGDSAESQITHLFSYWCCLSLRRTPRVSIKRSRISL